MKILNMELEIRVNYISDAGIVGSKLGIALFSNAVWPRHENRHGRRSCRVYINVAGPLRVRK